MIQRVYLPEGALYSTPQNREYISSLAGLERAQIEGRILEGVVKMCDSDSLNLHIDLYGTEGIIPKEECVLGEQIKDIAIITRVGKIVAFKVIGFEEGKNNKKIAILSRKEAQRECLENYLMDLIPGDIIPAKITHIEPFGAFVDIGCGIVSLLSVDSISVSRISTPRDRFSLRESICVVVKSIDYENQRIFVSTKELFGTWEENASRFSVGQTVSGIIRSVESYGIFVELAPNLAGLAELRDEVYVGDRCAAYIKSIMPDKMKIKLVIIDTYENQDPPGTREHIYINTESVKHIDRWQYSPNCSQRLIESNFQNKKS
ncbi:MAG: S1 RNA-binding domain-containing protein [Clostridia bacterium]|nr:S1 RNA-binding domain-containing protein [Clostridia bacterium]